MNGKFYALLGVLLLLPACFFNEKQTGAKHTFFVQAPLDSESIKNVHKSMKPVIDKIIQEELGIEHDKNFAFFFKKRQAVTIYYINDLYDNNEPITGLMYLFVEPALDSLPKPLAPQHATLASKVDFFGEQKEGLFAIIDLVSFIDDHNGELSALNKQMKKTMHHANQEYKRAYKIDLYDTAKSEQYDYLPHITLGHLRANYIKYLVNDSSKADAVLERIKQRIKKTVSDALANLTQEDRKLSFDSLALYDARKKKYVHKRILEQTACCRKKLREKPPCQLSLINF